MLIMITQSQEAREKQRRRREAHSPRYVAVSPLKLALYQVDVVATDSLPQTLLQ